MSIAALTSALEGDQNVARRPSTRPPGATHQVPRNARLEQLTARLALALGTDNRSELYRQALDDWLSSLDGDPITATSLQAELEEYAVLSSLRRADEPAIYSIYLQAETVTALATMTARLLADGTLDELRMKTKIAKSTKEINQGMILSLALLRYARRKLQIDIGLRPLK